MAPSKTSRKMRLFSTVWIVAEGQKVFFFLIKLHGTSSSFEIRFTCYQSPYINGLMQDYSISIAIALEILQSCTKPSISECRRGLAARTSVKYECDSKNLPDTYVKQGKSERFDSCDRPSNLTQIPLKSSIFWPV